MHFVACIQKYSSQANFTQRVWKCCCEFFKHFKFDRIFKHFSGIIRVIFRHIGFLGSFLANNLKTNQLEVNTDLQTSRAIARLKEPRNLFALPKDKDNECSQQTARWPAECQVSANSIVLSIKLSTIDSISMHDVWNSDRMQ